MEGDQIRKINGVKDIISGLGKVPLSELLLYIDDLVKNYEDQRKV